MLAANGQAPVVTTPRPHSPRQALLTSGQSSSAVHGTQKINTGVTTTTPKLHSRSVTPTPVVAESPFSSTVTKKRSVSPRIDCTRRQVTDVGRQSEDLIGQGDPGQTTAEVLNDMLIRQSTPIMPKRSIASTSATVHPVGASIAKVGLGNGPAPRRECGSALVPPRMDAGSTLVPPGGSATVPPRRDSPVRKREGGSVLLPPKREMAGNVPAPRYAKLANPEEAVEKPLYGGAPPASFLSPRTGFLSPRIGAQVSAPYQLQPQAPKAQEKAMPVKPRGIQISAEVSASSGSNAGSGSGMLPM